VIAFMAGVMSHTDSALTIWANQHNPFFFGPNCDWLALLPFVALCAFLYLVARERLLRPIDGASSQR
jgi:hypothetical protein